MNELALFTMALGLSKPWQVVDIRFSKEEGRLDLRIDFSKGAKFPCSTCEKERDCEVHDTQDRTWRHLNFFQYETYLHVFTPGSRGSAAASAGFAKWRFRGRDRGAGSRCFSRCWSFS